MKDRDFDRLVREHAATVADLVRSLVDDHWAVEEITQNAFLRAWKYIDTFDNDASFERWILAIARNCVVDYSHHTRRRATVEGSSSSDEPRELESGLEIRDLLSRLPKAQRDVVLLAGPLGYDYGAIAERLQVPIGTVRSRLFRARLSLSELLRGSDGEVAQ